MNLSEEVKHVITLSTQDLYFLLRFVEDGEAYTEQGKRPSNLDDILSDMPKDIRPEVAKFFGEFAEFMVDVKKEITAHKEKKAKGKISWIFKPSKTYPEQVYKHLFATIRSSIKPILYPEYLYNMALTHALAILEAFLGDFLVATFTHRPKTLKSGHTASYEEILSFPSMRALTDYLADTRVKKILSDNNIDSVANALQQLFAIDISSFNDFAVIREAFYRRHVVVHNNGITDKKYCEKIPNSRVGVKLSTNYEYLANLFAAIGQLIDYLDKHFSRKMRYKREPGANLLLTAL